MRGRAQFDVQPHLFGEIVCYAMTLKARPLAAHAKHFIGLMQSVPVPGLMR